MNSKLCQECLTIKDRYMKEITFRPLRRDKKTGKIIVASYLSWYKIKCADRTKLLLTILTEYKAMNPDDLVYTHKGERLQGLEDDFTKGISSTQRYRCLGNGWQVDTIVYLFGYFKC